MAEANVPQDRKYSKDHEWVRVEGDSATVGITDFAQNALGEVTYVELPEAGTELTRGSEFAVVESLKAASDVYAPVSGTVADANAALEDEPTHINRDPYGEGWLCKLTGVSAAELGGLLTPEQYTELLSEQES